MGFIEVLHIKTPICARILVPKDRLAVFTNYPSVIKDQALEKKTVLTLFHPLVHSCFQPVSVHPSQCHQRLTHKSRIGRFSVH